MIAKPSWDEEARSIHSLWQHVNSLPTFNHKPLPPSTIIVIDLRLSNYHHWIYLVIAST